MQLLTMTCVIVASLLVATGPLAQNNSAPTAPLSPAPTGTTTGTTKAPDQPATVGQAPVGHRQPRRGDVPNEKNLSDPNASMNKEDLSGAIQEVLGNPSYGDTARRFQRTIAQTHGLDRAADVLERAFQCVLSRVAVDDIYSARNNSLN